MVASCKWPWSWSWSSRVDVRGSRFRLAFLVSMHLIWNLGSKLIRSNNQSRATLWVLETCLIVGLLPFMIILITVSLSSNTYNKASLCEDWTFEGRKSTLSKSLTLFEIACVYESCEVENKFHLSSQRVSPFYHGSESCFQELKQSDPINQEREYHPTSLLHPKK